MKSCQEQSYRLFRQQLGKEVFDLRIPYRDKELGLMLSGGIDSSVLCIIYSKQRKLRTYTIGFKDVNEFKLSSKVANKVRTIHTNITITKKDYLTACKELIELKGQELQVPNETFIYLIAKQFKMDIGYKNGILLSGEGADELFGGYTQILNTVPSMPGNLLDNYLSRIIYDKKLWLNTNQNRFKHIFNSVDIKGSNYDKIQNWLLKLHYPALLQRARSVNFVKGITVKFPYSNRFLVHFANVLPKTMRVNKTFLRICFGELLPNEVLNQEKIGFALPINLNKWQSWNIEFVRNRKSDINFWKDDNT